MMNVVTSLWFSGIHSGTHIKKNITVVMTISTITPQVKENKLCGNMKINIYFRIKKTGQSN